MRVVGAGFGRTGTYSLKLALQRLLNAPCYHMAEVFQRPQDVTVWREAAQGRMPDWEAFFQNYAAAVDWPASAFWPELSAAFPEALIILSVRDSESWWKSASETIFSAIQSEEPDSEWHKMIEAMMANRFTNALHDREACIATFERHNAQVRESVPAHRLLEWRASDGWEPLCAALTIPVPDEPFPHTNTTEEFIARIQAREQQN